jgi:hypothetical protein
MSKPKNELEQIKMYGQQQQCFICENFFGRSEVREAMTMQLNDRLNQCAQNLQDETLLAKLSVGDAIAQEVYRRA